ncbi:hypothetical protein M433DRAFT_152639 [Acidomyces richmondensis BFW]|nr:MAG: hypothetical protein FE78DRAFT_87948 [Acidomyces sp. 'richmondensis']KYG47098.1 hypothetical protein M433DRAFT_152639 [Acidomyces richmondensis BFW]
MALSVGSDFRSLSRQPPPDPDIQSTLSDFLTYTEHFPSHLMRALTLIDEERKRSERHIKAIHDDATTYSLLPKLKEKHDPVILRRNISNALENAERSCRMAVAEAARLDDMCQREAWRLNMVMEKLKAQPLPPSRDPTPEQQALTSPNLKRGERRLSVRIEEEKFENGRRHLTDKAATKLRGRKVMVPGEVLPPPDPNAPVESISDWTSPRVSPPVEESPTMEQKGTPRPRSRTPKPPKRDKEKKPPKPRGPRAPGQPGTNAHSAVAGISTSNALLALTPPPEDALKGSKWLPWMKLTEWEMAKLRKRMKKNAIWIPSQTMVRRELKNLGRGLAGKEAAKAAAELTGEKFIDEHNEPDPTKVVVTGEETAQINALLGEQAYMGAEDDDADAELINRGMRLNEAKKLKRQRMLEEQAQAAAQIQREQAVDSGADGASSEVSKKRKREATPARTTVEDGILDTPDPLSKPGPALKKLKINPPAPGAGTMKIPLAPAGVSSSPKSISSRNRMAATPPPNTRKPQLGLTSGRATSEELPNRRASLRRGSNASMPAGAAVLTSPLRNSTTASSLKPGGRRSRRPAPGILTTTDDGDAKVGVSKRKAAPKKKGASLSSNPKTPTAEQQSTLLPAFDEEYIDPNEPRYCLCGDVSWGTMIACDNDDCEKEWFHLTCVGLEELPPRRTKWYCPDCRKRLKVGVDTNGLVGRQHGR